MQENMNIKNTSKKIKVNLTSEKTEHIELS